MQGEIKGNVSDAESDGKVSYVQGREALTS